MDLSKEQIIERIEAFTLHASRVQDLKDELLEIKMVGTGAELNEREGRINEIMQEIREIYNNHMLVIMKEMMDYVTSHHEEIADIIQKYEGEDFYAMVEQLLLNVQQEKMEREAGAEIPAIESFLI